MPDRASSSEPAILYVWNDRFCYGAPQHATKFSARYAATVLIAVDGAPMRLDFADGAQEQARAVMVAPHVSRQLHCEGSFVSFNYDPASFEYHQIAAHLRGRRTAPFIIEEPDLRAQLATFSRGELDCGEARRLSVDLVGRIIKERTEAPRTDLRVISVAGRLKAELPHPPSVEALARSAGVSPDWLGHLFTEQMGVSMKSYLLWAKVRRASPLLQTGMTLTQIAAEVGFSDAAHLSRAFKRFFGLQPSFLADPAKVRTHYCET